MEKNEGASLRKAALLAMVLCGCGVAVALYLVWLHYQVHTDASFHSFCAVSDAFNCETVAESPYSIFLGVPVAVWGLLGYLGMFYLAWLLRRSGSQAIYFLLLMASIAATGASVALALVSYCIICSFCLMCSVTYGINIVLLTVVVWMGVQANVVWRQGGRVVWRMLVQNWHVGFALFLMVLALIAIFPNYWDQSSSSLMAQESHVTPDGHHWVGAQTPSLTIVEFSDYLCPHCRRAHQYQRQLVKVNPDKLRLVHRHYPLDNECNPALSQPFHPGACYLAEVAVCAGEQGKFWEVNDWLYQIDELVGRTFEERAFDAAKRVGLDPQTLKDCLRSGRGREAVVKDIMEGINLGLRGTPSFVVDGEVHLGRVDQGVLQAHGVKN